MPSSVESSRDSRPVRSLDHIGPGTQPPLKATLRSDRIGPAADAAGLSFGQIVKTAVLSHFGGSVKAAAGALGDMDPSQMMRDLEAGRCGRLDQASDDVRIAVVDALRDAYGTGDRVGQLRREIRAARGVLDRMERILE